MHNDCYVGCSSYSDLGGIPSHRYQILPLAPPLMNGTCQGGGPLSMSQQMLMLCFISGQIEHSDWVKHIEEDPVLAAHFSLMWSART